MAWNDDVVNEVFGKCKQKAMVDKDYRAKILADPKAAIEETAGEKLPDDFKIQVIESDPAASMAFVLPPMPETNVELSDDDLENVAGGLCAQDTTVCVGNACGANK